jgi:hypothetical protein
MTEAVEIALIVACPPFIISAYNAYQANRIHSLVNSRMTEVKHKLSIALDKIVELEKQLAQKNK